MNLAAYSTNQQKAMLVFSLGFGSAVSHDLISNLSGLLDQGSSVADLFDGLARLEVVQTTFPFVVARSNTDFVHGVLQTAAHGANVATGVIDGWAQALAPFVGVSGLETRGKFMAALGNLIDGYSGADANLTALSNVLHNRMLVSSEYAHTTRGQTFPGFQALISEVSSVTSTAVTAGLRASPGVEDLVGTAGNDTFVAVGVTAWGQYSGNDTNFPSLSVLNGRTTSELNSGDSFNGQGGTNVLHVYGTADLSGVVLSNIQQVVLHSDVTFTAAQMAQLNTAGASIMGNGASIMRIAAEGTPTTVNMSNVQLQAIGQFDLAQSLTAQISQLGLDQIGTVSVDAGGVLEGAGGAGLSFAGRSVYGAGSVRDASAGLVALTVSDAVTRLGLSGLGAHLNTVVSSVSDLITQMNRPLAQGGLSGVPGYLTQDAVNLDVATMNLYLGSQTAADVVMAGSNAAFLRGGPGNDTLIGGSSTNFFSGSGGNDTLTGGPARDFFAGDEGDDTVYGLGGNDFINTQGGADTIYGGPGQDFIMPGDGADTVVVDDFPDFISLYASGSASTTDGAADTVRIESRTGLAGLGTTTNMIVGFETARDRLLFSESVFISGSSGSKSVIGTASAASPFDLNSANFSGIVKITDQVSPSFMDLGAKLLAAVSGMSAGDAVIFLVSNGQQTMAISWDDRAGSGANDGVMAVAEFTLIAMLVGVTDVSVLDAGNLGLV